MNQIIAYRTVGSSALAGEHLHSGEENIIDFRLAKARQSLELRQQRLSQNLAHVRPQPYSLQDILEESYTPERGIGELVGAALRRVQDGFLGNIFVSQLRSGTLKGRDFDPKGSLPIALSGMSSFALALIAVLAGA